MNKSIVIYNGKIEVKMHEQTLWLTQKQIANLFNTTKQNINLHANNVVTDGELNRQATVKKFLTVQKEGNRKVKRETEYYNLDMIISVGYRIKSKIATQFRIWATKTLKQHIVQGFTINKKRLDELKTVINIAKKSDSSEISGVANITLTYLDGLNVLDSYDHQTLNQPKGHKSKKALTLEVAEQIIKQMNFKGLFGIEREKGILGGILKQIDQSYAGKELYSSVEAKAAQLLYLLVKDHPFTDGNKRIAAALFITYLHINNMAEKIDNNTLAALTLLLAVSNPKEKEIMCLLVENMIFGKNVYKK